MATLAIGEIGNGFGGADNRELRAHGWAGCFRFRLGLGGLYEAGHETDAKKKGFHES